MAFVPGQAIPLKEPGATAGYFELKAPLLRQSMQRAITLAPAVLAEVAAGSTGVHILRGQWVGRAANGTWKAVGTGDTGFTSAAYIAIADCIEVAPLLNTTYDPDVWTSGSAAIIDAPFYEARTSTCEADSWVAGDLCTISSYGKLDQALATDYDDAETDVTQGQRRAIVGRVLQVENTTVNGVATTILTVRFKGTAWSANI